MIDTKSELSSVRGKLQDEREKLRLLQQRNSGATEAAAIAVAQRTGWNPDQEDPK